MAWVPIAAAVAGSVASSAMNNGGKGSATAPGGGYSLSMYEKMPPEIQARFAQSMSGMPNNVNIGFGGAQYPGMYGPFARAAKAAFTPAGATQMGQATPSGLAGGLASAAPWMWMAANNQGMFNFNQPQGGAMGGWSNQTPYGSVGGGGSMPNMSNYYGGYWI